MKKFKVVTQETLKTSRQTDDKFEVIAADDFSVKESGQVFFWRRNPDEARPEILKVYSDFVSVEPA